MLKCLLDRIQFTKHPSMEGQGKGSRQPRKANRIQGTSIHQSRLRWRRSSWSCQRRWKLQQQHRLGSSWGLQQRALQLNEGSDEQKWEESTTERLDFGSSTTITSKNPLERSHSSTNDSNAITYES